MFVFGRMLMKKFWIDCCLIIGVIFLVFLWVMCRLVILLLLFDVCVEWVGLRIRNSVLGRVNIVMVSVMKLKFDCRFIRFMVKWGMLNSVFLLMVVMIRLRIVINSVLVI